MLIARAQQPPPVFQIRADINHDGVVDMLDQAILANEWLLPTKYDLIMERDYWKKEAEDWKQGYLELLAGHKEIVFQDPNGVWKLKLK